MSQLRVCIIGHFAHGQTALNGQTVKTHNLYNGFCRYTGTEVVCVDTCGWKKRPLALYRAIVRGFRSCDHVIMLPAQNGVRVFAPLLMRLHKKYRKKIYYDVIGGWLPDLLEHQPKLQKQVGGFTGVWVETLSMKQRLEAQGLTNVTVVPNFKDLSPLSEEALVMAQDEPLRLCTFSRVSRAKGIETAVQAVNAVNARMGRTVYALDIYGQIDAAEKEWFDGLIKDAPACITYRGSVPPDQSVGVLQGYFALLFPTRSYTEGIPGTIIDAYAAGVPVVSAKWESFADLIDDGETGIGYPFDDDKEFQNVLLRLSEDQGIVRGMNSACIRKARAYTTEAVMHGIVTLLTEAMVQHEA